MHFISLYHTSVQGQARIIVFLISFCGNQEEQGVSAEMYRQADKLDEMDALIIMWGHVIC